MNTASGALSAVRRLSIVIAIAILFVLGLATTVYLSLRSPEVKVPDVMGKDRFEAERVLSGVGLNFRVRATRPSSQVQADTVLFQVPRAGEVVKVGQTVAMDISRSVKEGEASQVAAPETKPDEKTVNENTSASASPEANDNKPKRNKNTNTNKNANDNLNANNRNANANRKPANKNANTTNSNTTLNANRPTLIINGNSRSNANQNENRRLAAPKPAATAKPSP